MTNLTLADPWKTMAQHQASLRHYAKRVLLRGKILPLQEDNEKIQRMREYLAIGCSFGLAPKELVAVLYRGLFVSRPRRGCPGCRVRSLV